MSRCMPIVVGDKLIGTIIYTLVYKNIHPIRCQLTISKKKLTDNQDVLGLFEEIPFKFTNGHIHTTSVATTFNWIPVPNQYGDVEFDVVKTNLMKVYEILKRRNLVG